MYAIISLHDHILFIMAVILTFVSYLLITTLRRFTYVPHIIIDPLWGEVKQNNNIYESFITKYFSIYIEKYLKNIAWIQDNIWEKIYKSNKVDTERAFSKISESVWTAAPGAYYIWPTLAHCTKVEIYWTLLPCILLILIAIPSFWLLYIFDEILDPSITFKIIGHQWYWSYEMSDFNSLSMHWAWLKVSSHPKIQHDSYLLDIADLTMGDLRLLKTTIPLILPKDLHIRLLITSDDVLHSFSVPAFGIKLDAVPGRLNQVSTFIKDYGVFFGQCSELCGANHGFMPIEIFVVPLRQYYWFLYNTIISINKWWFMIS